MCWKPLTSKKPLGTSHVTHGEEEKRGEQYLDTVKRLAFTAELIKLAKIVGVVHDTDLTYSIQSTWLLHQLATMYHS